MDDQLLPCPFCGGVPAAIDNGYQTYWVMCETDDCHAAMGEVGVESPQEASRRWNRRHVSASAEQEP